MKQSFFKNVLYLFIISGLFNLTSCSSDDDTADINGDPIGEILPPLNLCDIMHDEGDLILTNDPNRPVDYIVNCVVDVKQRKMTIEPGTVIEFGNNGRINVQRHFEDHSGAIIARGTADKPIIFRGTEPNKGHWRGIMVATNNELNELDHVVIRDAGKEPYTHGGQGGLVLGNAGIGHGKIKLTNSQIINNREYGLVITNSSTTNQHNLTIKNNIIRENEMPVYATAFNIHFIDDSNDLTNNETNEITVSGSSNATHNTSLDGTWYNHNIPYSFTSNVYVDSKITIQAGTVLKFPQSAKLQIGRTSGPNDGTGGGIIANGTADQPIIFTGTEAIQGYWSGIEIESPYPGNEISHAIVEYTGMAPNVRHIFIDRNNPYNYIKLSNIQFRHSNHDGCAVVWDRGLQGSSHGSTLDIDLNTIFTENGHCKLAIYENGELIEVIN